MSNKEQKNIYKSQIHITVLKPQCKATLQNEYKNKEKKDRRKCTSLKERGRGEHNQETSITLVWKGKATSLATVNTDFKQKNYRQTNWRPNSLHNCLNASWVFFPNILIPRENTFSQTSAWSYPANTWQFCSWNFIQQPWWAACTEQLSTFYVQFYTYPTITSFSFYDWERMPNPWDTSHLLCKDRIVSMASSYEKQKSKTVKFSAPNENDTVFWLLLFCKP